MRRMLVVGAVVAAGLVVSGSVGATPGEEGCYRGGVWTSTASEWCSTPHQVVAVCIRFFSRVTMSGPAVAGGEWSDVSCPAGFRVLSID